MPLSTMKELIPFIIVIIIIIIIVVVGGTFWSSHA